MRELPHLLALRISPGMPADGPPSVFAEGQMRRPTVLRLPSSGGARVQLRIC
jgi:hypothetical protein